MHNTQIHDLVNEFVGKLHDAWNQSVVEALAGIGTGAGSGQKNKSMHNSSAKLLSTGARMNGRAKGEKRTSDELAALKETFVAFVGKHPGLRIEQIHKELGTNTKDLALPIRQLVAEGRIKTSGEKRSTTYRTGK